MKHHRVIRTLIMAAAVLAVVLPAGCAGAPESPDPSGIVWQRGSDPERDAPKWAEGGRAAIKAAGVSQRDIPKRALVYVGVSEDLDNERQARFKAYEDMFKRYAVFLQQDLDRILPEAADKAKVTLPNLNTALGADRALGFLPREGVERDLVRETWQAVGEGPQGTVYRVHVLGLIDRDARRAHLLEAAKETFKYAMISAANQARIMEEADKIIRRL